MRTQTTMPLNRRSLLALMAATAGIAAIASTRTVRDFLRGHAA